MGCLARGLRRAGFTRKSLPPRFDPTRRPPREASSNASRCTRWALHLSRFIRSGQGPCQVCEQTQTPPQMIAQVADLGVAVMRGASKSGQV